MKAILLSINPEHAYNIIKGRKTLELRKRVPKYFEGWVYVYVTKSYPLLNYIDNKYKLMDRKNHTIFHNIGMYEFYNDDIHLNGTIPFRFWFDDYDDVSTKYRIDTNQIERVIEQACIGYDEFDNYVGDRENIYGWHIKKLDIFDKPMQLGELYGKQKITKSQLDFISRHQVGDENYEYYRLTKAPQSYQYVWVKE